MVVAFAATLTCIQGAAAADVRPTAASSSRPRVLLLPYQPIYRSAPHEKATRATGFLFRELRKLSALEVVRGGIAVEREKAAEPNPIETAIATAEKSEAQKDIVAALAARRAVLDRIEDDPSRLADASDYVMAHHLLARAQTWAGRDAAAHKTIQTAVRMNPVLELPAPRFSRMYRRWVTQAAAEITRERTGELLVQSALPGATVFLAGREMDVAPVVLRKVVHGKHLVGAKVEGVPMYRAVVEVKAGARAEFRVNFGGTVGGTAVGEVTEAISVNGLPKAAVRSAVNAGQAVNARYVVARAASARKRTTSMFTRSSSTSVARMCSPSSPSSSTSTSSPPRRMCLRSSGRSRTRFRAFRETER